MQGTDSSSSVPSIYYAMKYKCLPRSTKVESWTIVQARETTHNSGPTRNTTRLRGPLFASTESNLTCTAIHLAHPHEKVYIHCLVVQVDTCVMENKTILPLPILLVGRGVIGSVEIQPMPVGDTHIKIDQVFSGWEFLLGPTTASLRTGWKFESTEAEVF